MSPTISKSNNNESDHIDPIQNAMGKFSKWQIFVCASVFLLKFPVAWHQMSIIFVAPPVAVHCLNKSIDTCSSSCTEFEYDKTTFTETIISTWNLVCNDKQWANFTQTIFMLGILAGNLLFGTLADKYGRRIPLVVAVLIQLLSGIATAFVPWFWVYCVLRFITGFSTGGTMTTSFVLIMEITNVELRELIAVLYQIPFNLGHLTLAEFAYFLRDWHHLQFALSIPSLLLISYYWIVPESPRWLYTVGRVEEAANVLTKAAKMNRLPTDTILKDLQAHKVNNNEMAKTASTENIEQSKGNILDLFRTPNMRKKTLCICFNWFVCGLAFFGVAQYIGQAGGDIFTNVAISAGLELPGTLFSIYTMKRFGRKMTLIASNTLTGLSMLFIAFIPIQYNNCIITLSSIGIIGMSISFPTVYLYASELFPTVVRNAGVGLASMIARIGSMIAPFVAGLSITYHWMPPTIFGLIPIIGAVLVFMLPETCGVPLPETIQDGENFRQKKVVVINEIKDENKI